MAQTQTTITITSPKIQATLDDTGQIICTPVSPEEMVTRTIMADSLSCQNFAARCCDLAGWTPTVPDPNHPGQTIPNPIDPGLPGLERTAAYWLAEGGMKAKQIVAAQQADAQATLVAAQAGAGITGIV